MSRRGLVALLFAGFTWAVLVLTPNARADQPLTPFPSPLSPPSAKGGGLTSGTADATYLRLDGTNWNTITGTLWTMALDTDPNLPGDRVTFTNGGSTTQPSAIRALQNAATGPSDDYAALEGINAMTTGTGAALLRLSSKTLAHRLDAFLFVGDATSTNICNNTEVCAPSDALLASIGAPQFTIGSDGGDTDIVIYGGNVGILNREMIRVHTNGVHLFHHNGNASSLVFEAETTCIGCQGASTASEYFDSVFGGLMLSNNNDSYDLVARYVANSEAGYTNSTASLTDVVAVAVVPGTYNCAFNGQASESTAADGAVVAWATTGTISVKTTDVAFFRTGDPGTVTTSSGAASLVSNTAATISAFAIVAHANVTVTVAGNFKIQASQAAHSTGTLTISSGAALRCERQ